MIFLDTSYIFAIINPNDQWHSHAKDLQTKIDKKPENFLTTEFILVEVADGLSSVRFRQAAAKIIGFLSNNELVTIIEANSVLVQRALELYEARQDKSWGLTDCSSFVVMTDYGVTEALTSDDDFRQAGFKALMLD